MTLEEIKQVMAHGPNCMNEDQYHGAVKALLAYVEDYDAALMQALNRLFKFKQAHDALVKEKAETMFKSAGKDAVKWAFDIGAQQMFGAVMHAIDFAINTPDNGMDEVTSREAFATLKEALVESTQDIIKQETAQ